MLCYAVTPLPANPGNNMLLAWFVLIWALVSYLFSIGFFKKLVKFVKYLMVIYQLPGPKRDPVFGNLHQLWCTPEQCFEKMREWSRTHGPLYLVSMTYLFPVVFISGPEAFEKIAGTTKNIQKGFAYNCLNLWLGEGLLTSSGSQWHTRRKILTPAFHFSILQQFVKVFNKETARLVEVLKGEIGKPSTNVVPLISQFTLYSISETSMGTSLNLDSEQDKNYVSAIYQIGKIVYYRLMRPWTYSNAIFYNLFPTGYKEKKIVKILHDFTDDIIEKRSKSLNTFDERYNYSNRKKMAFLDLLINAKINGKVIDDKGIKDEVNTFLFEGHDTIATSICFTLMLLANHKSHQVLSFLLLLARIFFRQIFFQDQIYEEICASLGDRNHNPEIKDLNELKFLERCIKESLRLYPSVPQVARYLEEDTLVGGHLLPKNTPVHVHIYDVHRNERDWPDPERFDPDRFLPENCAKRHPFAFCPFSAGPRNCIGQRFAILELKAVLCGIIKNFILEPVDTPDTIELVPDLILRTSNESLMVKFTPRNN
ncbi:unnamed protein product [Phyllotreta striolata]|uniref:Cytochrome P450 monooxygenase n=1 Tax=Phyllotreta striolata TaxID=444603 RepID=A0A9P0DQU8_PHYSR|nr:unnamed protein product [Phyllotreta striolata]